MVRRAGMAVAAWFLLTAFVVAQDGHFEASLNFGGTFPNSSTGNGITQSGTNGAGIFGTFRFRFNRKNAVAFNYGSGKDSQVYLTSLDFHVLTSMTEYTLAYMYSPFQNAKFETFVFAGGGWLAFNPQSSWIFYNNNTNNPFGINQTQVSIGASKQTELAFLYGVGLDYRLSAIPFVSRVPLSSRFAFRVQYRGLIYKNPDFNVNATTGSVPSLLTGTNGHMAEPSVGLVFKF
jgi:hypothetical protein